MVYVKAVTNFPSSDTLELILKHHNKIEHVMWSVLVISVHCETVVSIIIRNACDIEGTNMSRPLLRSIHEDDQKA